MSQIDGPLCLTTDSAEATHSVASTIAGLTRPGDLVLVIGDLGAGKTVFAKGFAKGLQIEDKVTSPTFALVHCYEGRLRMYHLDVYRLTHSSEVADLGLSELLDDDAVTLIEWGDMITGSLPQNYLEVRIDQNELGAGTESPGPDPDSEADVCIRSIRVSPRGASWRPRMAALRSALEPWLTGSGEQC